MSSTDTQPNGGRAVRYVPQQTDRGADDLERCVEVGHAVLKALERLPCAGKGRVEVYGAPGKERVDLVRIERAA